MSKPQRLCVYCGKPGVTKEHFWGRWSRRHALTKHDRVHHELASWEDPYNEASAITIKRGMMTRPGAPRSQSLWIACRDCNGGWMKHIVDNAIPIMTRLSFGYWGRLSDDDRCTIANWATLFTMSYEFVDFRTVCVSQAERELFRSAGRPSKQWKIAIGFGEPNIDADRVTHRALALSAEYKMADPNSQITVWFFGKLIIVTMYSKFLIPLDWSTLSKRLALAPLWPLDGMAVQKPFGIHGDGAIDEILTAVHTGFDAAAYENRDSLAPENIEDDGLH